MLNFDAVIAALVSKRASSAELTPILPGGTRQDVVDTLTRVMTDPEAFASYFQKLVEELERFRIRLPLLTKPGLDFPESEVAELGFSGLSDEQLADLAGCPEALLAMREYLEITESERGNWFFDAIMTRSGYRRDFEKESIQVPSTYQLLAETGVPIPSTAKSEVVTSSEGKNHHEAISPWFKLGSALAATLLIGILIGYSFFGERNSPKFVQDGSISTGVSSSKKLDKPEGNDSLLVKSRSSPKYDKNRTVVFRMTPSAPGAPRGFATFIAFADDRPPEVYPEAEADKFEVVGGQSYAYGPFTSNTTYVKYVFTNEPAAESIREFLRNYSMDGISEDRLNEDLKKYLKHIGFFWVEIGEKGFGPSKE